MLPSLFSRRKREACPQSHDVYTYDDIPQKVRVQIVQILSDAIGPFDIHNYAAPPGRPVYDDIVRIMRREKGVFELYDSYERLDQELFNWLLNEKEIDHLLDGIEYSFWKVDTYISPRSYDFKDYSRITPTQAIKELNARLQEASVGYQFESGDIVKVDSQILHSEVVVPALRLISDPIYAAVDREYREAHSNFRSGDFETCLVECAKAFESTLKVIGEARKWPIKNTDPASKLLTAAFAANFIPEWMQAEFNSLRSLLESSVPTVRNKMGGHGAGTTIRQVSKELAAFQIHQTAACIVFLIDHHKAQL